jgi:hypothetical protein
MSRLVAIEGYDDYFISDDGKVFSTKYKEMREVKQRINKQGRPYVNLCKNGKYKSFVTHRLVAKHYLPDFTLDLQVNHIDGDKTNNNVSNLEMVTQSENMQHAVKTGLLVNHKGEEHWDAKLTEKEVKEIRSKYIPNVYGIKKLAKEYQVSESTIKFIIKRVTWKHI